MARALRREHGLSVKRLARILGVSQSSVSLWVRDIELTEKQRANLRPCGVKGVPFEQPVVSSAGAKHKMAVGRWRAEASPCTLPVACSSGRKARVTGNRYSKHSQKKPRNKLPYGTCRLALYDTTVVQHLYGAIQEYGGFEREEWVL